MNKIFITGQIEQNGLTILKKRGYSLEVNPSGHKITSQQLKEVVGEYNAVITMVTDKVTDDVLQCSSPNLKVIANYGVGFDNIDVVAAKHRDITVTNTPGVAGESVAEHAFMLILACSKRLVEADRFVRQGHYHGWDPKAFLSPQVWGQTLGIVGLGRIGTYVGHIAYGGFKMNILYTDISRSEDFEMLTEAKYTHLETLLKNSDIVTLHAPLTPQTRHMIGRKEFSIMKNSAILINTARGPIVDEEALVWALKEGEIAGAGLDVFENESEIPAELRTLPSVALTPHSASATYETRQEMSRIAAGNVISVLEGKTPFGLVKVV